MSACGEWAWFHPEKGVQAFLCGSMSCPRQECRKLFWSRRVRLIAELIGKYGLIRFFTLTLDRGILNPVSNPWDYIHHVWSKFRKRMRRKCDFKFVAVLESHKDRKWPHIHGFTNVWMRQSEWSEKWAACGGGTVVWIEAVDNPNLSQYVSKELNVARYVGKEQLSEAYEEKKKHRTLWRSENLKADFELESDSEWCIIKEGVYDGDGVRPFFQEHLGVTEYGSKKEQERKDMETTCGAVLA